MRKGVKTFVLANTQNKIIFNQETATGYRVREIGKVEKEISVLILIVKLCERNFSIKNNMLYYKKFDDNLVNKPYLDH